MADLTDALALNLRGLRETYGLSLSQLSERSGVAKATLFKIERGRTNPTLDTLISIATSFDVSVPSLIAIPDAATVDILHDGEGEDISDIASQGQILRRQVIGAGTLEIHSQRFLHGLAETSTSHGPGAREHVFVRSGSIRIGPTGIEQTISVGDYATYPADRIHRWEAVDGDALVWIAHTFPRSGAFLE